MPGVPHPIPFRTRSLSPPGPMVLRLKARESRSPPGPHVGCPHAPHRGAISKPHPSLTNHTPAGWSSPVARQAHNLKVTGSNPVPAPSDPPQSTDPSDTLRRSAKRPWTRSENRLSIEGGVTRASLSSDDCDDALVNSIERSPSTMLLRAKLSGVDNAGTVQARPCSSPQLWIAVRAWRDGRDGVLRRRMTVCGTTLRYGSRSPRVSRTGDRSSERVSRRTMDDQAARAVFRRCGDDSRR